MRSNVQGFAQILFIIVVVVVSGIAAGIIFTQQGLKIENPFAVPTPQVCTKELKLCEDGTRVGRSGLQCDFSPCGSTTDLSVWQTFTYQDVSLKHPPDWQTSTGGNAITLLSAGTKNERPVSQGSKITISQAYETDFTKAIEAATRDCPTKTLDSTFTINANQAQLYTVTCPNYNPGAKLVFLEGSENIYVIEFDFKTTNNTKAIDTFRTLITTISFVSQPQTNASAGYETYQAPKLYNSLLATYAITYPKSWKKFAQTDVNVSYNNFKLVNGEYEIRIDQGFYNEGVVCVFNDTPNPETALDAISDDLRAKDYVDIDTPAGKFRRYLARVSHSGRD